MLCSGCVRVCSTLFELYWLTKLHLILHNLAAIWLMKTIANVPYFLSPKSTIHSSTTAKFSTRIRLNLVGFQTFARRARTRVHCKTKFSMRGSGDGQSPDRHRIFRGYVHGHAFLTVTGLSDKPVTAQVLLKQPHGWLRKIFLLLICPFWAAAPTQAPY